MRSAVILGAVLIAAPVAWTVASTGDGSAPRVASHDAAPTFQTIPSVADTTRVRVLLAGVRGANEVQCQLGVHSLDLNFGFSWRRTEIVPDAPAEPVELVRWATGRVRDTAAVPPLRAALDDPDRCVRRIAARLLGRMRQDRATQTLLEALRSSSVQTRELALLGLGFAEDEGTVRHVIATLDDASVRIRAAGAWALGRIESREALPALTRALQTDSDPSVRQAAAWAIGSMH